MSAAGMQTGAARPLRSVAQEGVPVNGLLLLMVTLIGFGLVMMTSASIEIASSEYGDAFYFLKRQLLFVGLSSAVVLLTLHVPVSFWYRISAPLLILSLVLLALVLVPGVGTVVNGSARWIDLGFYNLQPSEMSKIFLVVYLAAFLQRRQHEVHERWSGFIKPITILAAVIALLHFEPDHGAMVILMLTTFAMLFLAGARLHRFILILLACLGAVITLAVMKPYVIDRLTSFLNPWAAEYVYGEGYQLTQALIAFGRGEWLGAGLGNSIQKLYFLPEAHTDFIVAIIAEELGFLGVGVTVALFAWLITRALKIGRSAEKQGRRFDAYLCYGIGMLFASQVFINFGVSSGLLPTKGLTLPFLSYGGNSLLVSCFMVALLVRVQYELSSPGRGGRS